MYTFADVQVLRLYAPEVSLYKPTAGGELALLQILPGRIVIWVTDALDWALSQELLRTCAYSEGRVELFLPSLPLYLGSLSMHWI